MGRRDKFPTAECSGCVWLPGGTWPVLGVQFLHHPAAWLDPVWKSSIGQVSYGKLPLKNNIKGSLVSTCCVACTQEWKWCEAISLPSGTFTRVTSSGAHGGAMCGHYGRQPLHCSPAPAGCGHARMLVQLPDLSRF